MVTVTVLIDPPPHFIWQVDEVKTKAAVDAYKLAQKHKRQRKEKEKAKAKERKRIEEEEKKKKTAEDAAAAVDEDGNAIEKPPLSQGGDAFDEEEGDSIDGSSPAKSPRGTVVVGSAVSGETMLTP